jgi:hypothetical protein
VDLGAFILSAALLGLVVYLIARPLLNQGRPKAGQPRPAAALEAERERLLAALRDLDLDHATGKVSPEDYAVLRPELVAQGAAVLRRLDALAVRPTGRRVAPSALVDDEIEAAVRVLRPGSRLPKAYAPAPAASACPACGQPANAPDRFCSSCGAPLHKPAHHAKAAR